MLNVSRLLQATKAPASYPRYLFYQIVTGEQLSRNEKRSQTRLEESTAYSKIKRSNASGRIERLRYKAAYCSEA